LESAATSSPRESVPPVPAPRLPSPERIERWFSLSETPAGSPQTAPGVQLFAERLATRIHPDAVYIPVANCTLGLMTTLRSLLERSGRDGGEVAKGIPILTPASNEPAHEGQQKVFFDALADTSWGLERPAGSPRFHAWLLADKFRRATSDFNIHRPHSGRRNARLGHGVKLDSIVADAEQLPFADGGVDVVYVHDGLHHLEDPFVGLGEMCRVAGVAVSVSEPAQAVVTRAAVSAGVAEEVEEAGSVVARLDAQAVNEFLDQRGFRVTQCERYGMLYRHGPGLPMPILSLPGIFQFATWGMRLTNRVLGRWGNKLVVIGVLP